MSTEDLTCEHELCRDPFGQAAYVASEEDGIYCLFCYLVHVKGMDAEEASEVTFQNDSKPRFGGNS